MRSEATEANSGSRGWVGDIVWRHCARRRPKDLAEFRPAQLKSGVISAAVRPKCGAESPVPRHIWRPTFMFCMHRETSPLSHMPSSPLKRIDGPPSAKAGNSPFLPSGAVIHVRFRLTNPQTKNPSVPRSRDLWYHIAKAADDNAHDDDRPRDWERERAWMSSKPCDKYASTIRPACGFSAQGTGIPDDRERSGL